MRHVVSMLAIITVILGASAAQAQKCGDADDNGSVTVTDGVQALRAAAGLSSTCGAACDLDTSGVVTVSDGVNILRKAIGFAVNEACDFTTEDANDVVGPSLVLFDALTKVPGIAPAGADIAGTAAPDCENDGTVEVVQTPNVSAATFTNCQIDGAILDGTISRAVLSSGVGLGFDGYRITRIKNGRTLTFNGTLVISSEQIGRRITGILNLVSSEHGPFTEQFQRILLVGNRVVQGSLIYDLTDSDSPRIARIKIDFSDADELPVTIELRSGKVRQFTLDRGTRIIGLPG